MAEKIRTNEAGLLEGYDPESGELLWTEAKKPGSLRKIGKPRGRPTKASLLSHHWVLDAEGNKFWLPRGTNPENIPAVVWPFSPITAKHICDRISEGMTIRDIEKLDGYPPRSTISHWARKHSDFDRDMKSARVQRATHYHDQIIEIALDTKKRKNLGDDRFKVDTLKWAAAVGDPETFGSRTKLVGDPDKPIQFFIDTGIRRPEDVVEPEVVAETPQLSPPDFNDGDGAL